MTTGIEHLVRGWPRSVGRAANWKSHVEVDPALFRPADVNTLGDAGRARAKLGWVPR